MVQERSEVSLRQEIVDIGRWMWEKGFVAANDGNISVRMPDGSLLVTPSGVSKGMMNPEMILRLDVRGNVEGKGRISTEVQMHQEVYRQRPDVSAVVHAHPIYATTFAAAELSLDRPLLPEILVFLKEIPLAEYATPSTKEVALSIRELIKGHDALLLSHHGAVTVGSSLKEAYYAMERVESYAHIVFNLMMLDRVKELPHGAVERLKNLRT